jgi:hypothetical protein
MPTNRRRRLQPLRSDEYSERTIVRLETGHDFDFLGGRRLTDEELRQVWDEVGEEILAREPQAWALKKWGRPRQT